jgi:hypothetical protein
MKKFILNLLFIAICAFSISAQSQVTYTGLKKDYTQSMDSLLLNINKTPIMTGILYDRIMPFANLNMLKENGLITKANYTTYIQSYSELYRAAYNPTFSNVETIKANITSNTNPNIVDIGIINTKMNYIDYGLPTQKSMNFVNGRFVNISGINPFLEKQITIIAPLKDKIRSNNITFRLLQSSILQLSGSPIKNLVANFGTATNYNLITNQVITSLYPIITFATSGKKTFTFTITFSNNSTETLTATMYIEVPPVGSTSLSSKTSFPPEEDFVGSAGITTTSTGNIAFQGYNDTTPLKGTLEYRTYYNTVTNPGYNEVTKTFSEQPKIRKEIILLDGYDPTDTRKIYTGSIGYDSEYRSLYELMYYDVNGLSINLVDKLRAAPYGFDVTLVNFPNGADYVERNAMAVVSLLTRENQKLTANGSTEKISIIGPSMGGLISRYALAYMEKNGLNHNTKLWVSYDSPHLGANIPMSAQESIYFFGFNGKLEDAKTKFTENFFTPAARQMLIEQLDFRHQANPNLDNPGLFSGTITAGQNNGSPFRQQFTTSLNTNGLPNSNGFPQNLRKVAIINGTSNGSKTFSEYEKYLDLAAFVKAKLGQIFGTEIIFRYKAASFENRFQATPNNFSKTFTGLATVVSDLAVVQGTINRRNINPRGSMDNVPGGTYEIADIIQKGFNKGLDAMPIVNERDWRVENYHKAAFIPSVSSLAFKNPNFDWSTPFNRNLVCNQANKEIPFDSYFVPATNEDHVKVTAENANWLINELQGNPQAPHFPIQTGSLTGPDVICDTNVTYFFADLCKVPSPVIYTQNGIITNGWSVSANLNIVSSTPYSITVSQISNGQGTINATFQNGQTFKKDIWIGSPQLNQFTFGSGSISPCIAPVDCLTSGLESDEIYASFSGMSTSEINTNSNWEWALENNLIMLNGVRDRRVICPLFLGTTGFKVRAKNACGWSEWVDYPTFEITECPNSFRLSSNTYIVYPNPSDDIVNIELRDANSLPEKETIISGELFDMLGLSKSKVEIINNKATFSVRGLNIGIYVLKIYINDKVESYQIAVE